MGLLTLDQQYWSLSPMTIQQGQRKNTSVIPPSQTQKTSGLVLIGCPPCPCPLKGRGLVNDWWRWCYVQHLDDQGTKCHTHKNQVFTYSLTTKKGSSIDIAIAGGPLCALVLVVAQYREKCAKILMNISENHLMGGHFWSEVMTSDGVPSTSGDFPRRRPWWPA